MVRHYHGHLSAVYCMSIHPSIDILVTGSRDASARVREREGERGREREREREREGERERDYDDVFTA